MTTIRTAAAMIAATAMTTAPAWGDGLDGAPAGGMSILDSPEWAEGEFYTLPGVDSLMAPSPGGDWLLVPSQGVDSEMEWLPPQPSDAMPLTDPPEASEGSP